MNTQIKDFFCVDLRDVLIGLSEAFNEPLFNRHLMGKLPIVDYPNCNGYFVIELSEIKVLCFDIIEVYYLSKNQQATKDAVEAYLNGLREKYTYAYHIVTENIL